MQPVQDGNDISSCSTEPWASGPRVTGSLFQLANKEGKTSVRVPVAHVASTERESSFIPSPGG